MLQKEKHSRTHLTVKQRSLVSPFAFPCLMWGLSRALIALCIVLVPDSVQSTAADWQRLIGWDSRFYLEIATTGYTFIPDGKGYNIAFFPGFPLLIRLGTGFGFSPQFAAVLINNLFFLLALIGLFQWLTSRYNRSVARWAIATFAWCPFSLFCSVAYAEGAFLLFSTLALKAFEEKQPFRAAIWGSFATATRLPGICLVPTFLGLSWRDRRDWRFYLAGLMTSSGFISFILFCTWRFDAPFAFIQVQSAWNPPNFVFGQGWLKSLVQVFCGPTAWERQTIHLIHLLAILTIIAIAVLLLYFRQSLRSTTTHSIYCGLILVTWLIAGSPFINLVTVWGAIALLWYARNNLTSVAFSYGIWSMAFILSTGRTISAERHTFAVVSVAIALGFLCHQYPRWGYSLLGFFGVLLICLSVRFIQGYWAG